MTRSECRTLARLAKSDIRSVSFLNAGLTEAAELQLPEEVGVGSAAAAPGGTGGGAGTDGNAPLFNQSWSTAN